MDYDPNAANRYTARMRQTRNKKDKERRQIELLSYKNELTRLRKKLSDCEQKFNITPISRSESENSTLSKTSRKSSRRGGTKHRRHTKHRRRS